MDKPQFDLGTASKRAKLSTRLAGAFGLMVAMLLAVVAMALWSMQKMRASTVEINTNVIPSVEMLAQINTQKSDLRFFELRHVMTGADIGIGEVERLMAAKLAEVEKSRQAYEKMIRSDEERQLYDTFSSQWKQYLQVHERVLDLSRKHNTEDAGDLVFGESGKLYEASALSLLKAIDLNHRGAIAEGERSDSAYSMARIAMIASGLACALLAVAQAIWLVRSIVSELGGEPAEVAALANFIANADLSRSISVRPGDSTSVVSAMARMRESLTAMVGAVRVSSECVATTSDEIAQGNNDLSQRTDEQASALEETSTSMAQLTSAVRHNADSASEANKMARGAAQVALKGRQVVSRIVETMREINESSTQIAVITSVIDGIAFQTNILALNAAVEAARAGEQGRGFAVVASEVRSLAARSAAAAKEIKALIGTSVERVETGTTLVNHAGGTMTEVVESIQRVTDIMGEISSASAQQDAGVSQVARAIDQMNQMTQRNAALVEQSAAASDSLRQQARELVSMVAVYNLDQRELAVV